MRILRLICVVIYNLFVFIKYSFNVHVIYNNWSLNINIIFFLVNRAITAVASTTTTTAIIDNGSIESELTLGHGSSSHIELEMSHSTPTTEKLPIDNSQSGNTKFICFI